MSVAGLRTAAGLVSVHRLPATPPTVHWGYFDPRLEPVLTVESGDLVAIETLTHHAGDAPDLLMDEGIERVFADVTTVGPDRTCSPARSPSTGPRPGDVLQVDILEATPRLPYGSNLAAHWGYLYDGFRSERVTIYELDARGAASGGRCSATTGPRPRSSTSPARSSSPTASRAKPRIAGRRRPASSALRHDGRGAGRARSGVSSVPPGDHGGNIDNWRIGAGGPDVYPVQVPGRAAVLGDPHVSQGDGEVSGTALEASLNGLLRLTIRRDLPFTCRCWRPPPSCWYTVSATTSMPR